MHPSPIWPPGRARVCVIAVSSQVLVQSGQIVTEPSHVTHVTPGRGVRALALLRPGWGSQGPLRNASFQFPKAGATHQTVSRSSRQLRGQGRGPLCSYGDLCCVSDQSCHRPPGPLQAGVASCSVPSWFRGLHGPLRFGTPDNAAAGAVSALW